VFGQAAFSSGTFRDRITRTTGVGIARALDATTAFGQIKWVALLSGR